LHASLSTAWSGLEVEFAPGRVRIAGEIDISNSNELAVELGSGVARDNRLVVDLSKTSFIDVSGARRLLELARRCRPNEVCVLGAPTSRARILEVGGWHNEVSVLEETVL
jgi:anti-anti-sigma factor